MKALNLNSDVTRSNYEAKSSKSHIMLIDERVDYEVIAIYLESSSTRTSVNIAPVIVMLTMNHDWMNTLKVLTGILFDPHPFTSYG